MAIFLKFKRRNLIIYYYIDLSRFDTVSANQVLFKMSLDVFNQIKDLLSRKRLNSILTGFCLQWKLVLEDEEVTLCVCHLSLKNVGSICS